MLEMSTSGSHGSILFPVSFKDMASAISGKDLAKETLWALDDNVGNSMVFAVVEERSLFQRARCGGGRVIFY